MENIFKFKIGDIISFERNQSIKSEGTQIIAIVDNFIYDDIRAKISNIEGERTNIYIIENENGWSPTSFRVSKYNLDLNKRYLFVSEEELTEI